MITPFLGRQRKVRFRTYDLEWYPGTLTLRLVGEHDGSRYTSYKTIRAFLQSALRPVNSGLVWFAHAGGLADVQFILEEIAQDARYSVQCIMSGSSAIMVRITDDHSSWTFADSYWLLRSPLKQIGASIGIPKLSDYRCPHPCQHEEGHCVFYAPPAILETYNEQDCLILWTALDRFQDTIMRMGGAMKRTLAATAMHLFRSRYLHREIPTLDGINSDSRLAYVASRVEVFRPSCERANYYDVNSSFPASMTLDQPGRMFDVTTRIPDSGLFLAHCQVTVPEVYIPPLPYRAKGGRIYFPTGSWDAWLMASDVEYLLSKGGKIGRVEKVLRFQPFADLRDYALVLYELKANAKDPFERMIWKLLLNSLYGKFAERAEKERILINPPSTEGLELISPGIFREQETADLAHVHVPIAANITSLSRTLLGRYLDQAHDLGEVYYADTDSVVTNATLSVSDELGLLKLEKEVTSGRFLAPKLYAIVGGGGKVTVRAKGFRRMGMADFQTLEKGGTIEVTRMVRVKENANYGDLKPREKIVPKRYIGARPKRSPDGADTRPWKKEEIE